MIETWKDIPGYNGKYQADCEGNIRRVYKNGKTKMLTPYLKNQRKRKVYVVKLTIDGKSKEEIMLGLMARTFLGPAPKGHVAYHINGCKSEHNIQNIAYISKKELGKLTGARARRQAVAKIDSNGEIVDVYSSAREAARNNYMCYQTIMDYCNGERKGAYAPDGYAYAWEDSAVSMRNAIAKIEQTEGYMRKAPDIEFEW